MLINAFIHGEIGMHNFMKDVMNKLFIKLQNRCISKFLFNEYLIYMILYDIVLDFIIMLNHRTMQTVNNKHFYLNMFG
jgi:hypothetical protein